MVKYFVSFWYVKGGGIAGIGNGEAELNRELKTMDGVEGLQDELRRKGYPQAIIINWKKLED